VLTVQRITLLDALCSIAIQLNQMVQSERTGWDENVQLVRALARTAGEPVVVMAGPHGPSISTMPPRRGRP
jgi:hypothetical protein